LDGSGNLPGGFGGSLYLIDAVYQNQNDYSTITANCQIMVTPGFNTETGTGPTFSLITFHKYWEEKEEIDFTYQFI